jgi:hypothetical protein
VEAAAAAKNGKDIAKMKAAAADAGKKFAPRRGTPAECESIRKEGAKVAAAMRQLVKELAKLQQEEEDYTTFGAINPDGATHQAEIAALQEDMERLQEEAHEIFEAWQACLAGRSARKKR